MDNPWFKSRQGQENFSHLQGVHTNRGVQPVSCSEGSRVLCQGKKLSRSEMYHLPALVLRSRMIVAILLYCCTPHGVVSDTFTLTEDLHIIS